MNAQLLLLLALVGPFCGFTHASPTALPTDLDVGAPTVSSDVPTDSIDVTSGPHSDATEAPKEDFTVITDPPPTDPAAAPKEGPTEAVTTELLPPAAVTTETPVLATTVLHAVTEAEGDAPLITDAPVVETAAPTAAAETDAYVVMTVAPQPEEDVVIVDEPEAGLSSGQVVGIVIGALLAVVIVIAVVIAAVRRMGKYSP